MYPWGSMFRLCHLDFAVDLCLLFPLTSSPPLRLPGQYMGDDYLGSDGQESVGGLICIRARWLEPRHKASGSILEVIGHVRGCFHKDGCYRADTR